MRRDVTQEELLLERAWALQGMIKAQRQNLKQQEAELKEILAGISAKGQSRYGRYGISKKTQQRRAIKSDQFFRLWPQVFLRLAKVSIKDAEAELGKEQLEAAKIFDIKEQVTLEVIRYELPEKKPTMV
jgi:ATP-dependent DNA helicase RecQ